MSIENLKDHNEETGHEFHMVDVSPWPMFISFTLLILALGFVLFLHKEQKWLLYLGGISTLGIMFLWFKDIIKEAIIDKAHNTRVRRGLVWGMKLLIISELMFFVAFFWSNIYYLMFGPTELAEANIWQITKGTWPPVNIEKINPFGLPLLNTLILALSGCAVSLSHQAILENNNKILIKFI